MGYRFIDTNFFKSPYVRGLKGTMKYLYGYIITDCSSAGIWTVDIPIACIYIDSRIEFNEAKKVFIESGKAIDLGNGKWFFPDFIQHQYPKGLSEKNPAHNNIILELKKYNLLDENLNVIKGTTKGLPSTSQGTMVMVMEKVMDKEEVMVMEKEAKIKKNEIAPSVFVSDIEAGKLHLLFGDGFRWALEKLSNYKLSSGKKYKSDYHALIGWVKDDYFKQKNNGKQSIEQKYTDALRQAGIEPSKVR